MNLLAFLHGRDRLRRVAVAVSSLGYFSAAAGAQSKSRLAKSTEISWLSYLADVGVATY